MNEPEIPGAVGFLRRHDLKCALMGVFGVKFKKQDVALCLERFGTRFEQVKEMVRRHPGNSGVTQFLARYLTPRGETELSGRRRELRPIVDSMGKTNSDYSSLVTPDTEIVLLHDGTIQF